MASYEGTLGKRTVPARGLRARGYSERVPHNPGFDRSAPRASLLGPRRAVRAGARPVNPNVGPTTQAMTPEEFQAKLDTIDFATFHCDDISVVNGAQTVGAIGKFSELHLDKCVNVLVPVRIIVRGEDVGFGEEVTKTNNRQNRIENRDFVSLDPEQSRIRSELAIDGID